MFTKSFTEHVSIIVHLIREHELVTSVEDYNVLMLTSCRFVDCHVKGWRQFRMILQMFFKVYCMSIYCIGPRLQICVLGKRCSVCSL